MRFLAARIACAAVTVAVFAVSAADASAQRRSGRRPAPVAPAPVPPPPAQTEEEAQRDSDARRHFGVGESLYRSGRFEEAAREYEEAYRLSERPALLYNIYLSQRDAGNASRSAWALREYLAREPNAQDRAALEVRLRALEATAAEQTAREEELRRAQEEAERVREAERARLAAEEEERRRRAASNGLRVPGYILLGTGGAALIAGSITGFMTIDRGHALRAACQGSLCAPAFRDSISEANMLGGLTDVLLIAGGVVLAGGVVVSLLAVDGPPERASAELSPSLVCSSTGCMATVRGGF